MPRDWVAALDKAAATYTRASAELRAAWISNHLPVTSGQMERFAKARAAFLDAVDLIYRTAGAEVDGPAPPAEAS